ncbi:PREDICTED: uncharacterized protein LOC104817154 [Tarenaya hassleriana]|uniref:uncharacterized protein LOC104817154 n=1 Tax=Tarenaya hassleriana TaxID=28532 RepID=UPI00053CA4A7|nr:PREDICTED: uncharacterized protein LOC104817154 [Tarenaya hassleriana]
MTLIIYDVFKCHYMSSELSGGANPREFEEAALRISLVKKLPVITPKQSSAIPTMALQHSFDSCRSFKCMIASAHPGTDLRSSQHFAGSGKIDSSDSGDGADAAFLLSSSLVAVTNADNISRAATSAAMRTILFCCSISEFFF